MTPTRSGVDVSVVIATYNRGEPLRDTLESLLAQAGGAASYEAIVVDNNSTDHTKEVIQEFAAQRRVAPLSCRARSCLARRLSSFAS
jgi:glycosyltransferase involved in cell wall biosynthesis